MSLVAIIDLRTKQERLVPPIDAMESVAAGHARYKSRKDIPRKVQQAMAEEERRKAEAAGRKALEDEAKRKAAEEAKAGAGADDTTPAKDPVDDAGEQTGTEDPPDVGDQTTTEDPGDSETTEAAEAGDKKEPPEPEAGSGPRLRKRSDAKGG